MANERNAFKAGLFIVISLALIIGVIIAIKGAGELLEPNQIRTAEFTLADDVGGLRLGDDVRATYYLEQLLRCSEAAPAHLKENFVPFRELAGRLNLRLENYEKAAQHFEEVLRMAPGYKNAQAHLDGVRKKLAEARIE